MGVPISFRFASGLLWLSTIGLGVPCVMAISNLAWGKKIPYVFGFPAYGGGGFERHGLVTSIPLLIGFLMLCLIEGYSGCLLWNANKTGGIIALILLIPGTIYWWGFDLPYPPIAAIIRTVLIVINWSLLI